MGKSDLYSLAKQYVWWLPPEKSLEYPLRVYAKIMDLGTLEDIQTLISIVGEDALREALQKAEAGQFRPRSWSYWQYRLNHLEDNLVPPLPVRRVS